MFAMFHAGFEGVLVGGEMLVEVRMEVEWRVLERVLERVLGMMGYSYSAYDLMEMRRWIDAGVYKGVEALDDELGAAEADEGMAGCDERERCERRPIHSEI